MTSVLVELRRATVALAFAVLLPVAACGADKPTSTAPTSSAPIVDERAVLVPQILGHVWRADAGRDGRLAVMAGEEEAAIVDLHTDEVLAVAPGCVKDAALARDGRHVVLLTCVGSVHVWDLSRDLLAEIPGTSSPDRLEKGGPVVLARTEDSVEIVNLGTRRRTLIELGKGRVRQAFALSSGGVAVWQKDDVLRVFRASGEEVSLTKLDVRGRAIADEGAHSLLFVGDRDAAVVDVMTGYVLGRGTPCGATIEASAFTVNGDRVALRCRAHDEPSVVRLVDAPGDARLFNLDLTPAPGDDAQARAALAATPAEPARPRSERAAEIRVARAGKLSVTTPEPFVLDTTSGVVTRGAAMTESETPFEVREDRLTGWSLDVQAQEGERRVPLEPTAACATVSTDGAIAASVTALASAGRSAVVRIDRLREPGAFDGVQTDEALGGCSLALSSDGRFLRAGRAVYDTTTRRELWKMAASDATLTFLPGGRLAFANVPGRSRIIDVASGNELRVLENMAVLHGASDDGRYIVLSLEHRLVLVDGETGRYTPLPFDALHQVVWVSPGGTIAWIGTNAGLDAYRVADGARLRWIGGRGPVTDAFVFDPATADDLPIRVRRGSNILTATTEPLGPSSARAHPRLYEDFVAGKSVSPTP